MPHSLALTSFPALQAAYEEYRTWKRANRLEDGWLAGALRAQLEFGVSFDLPRLDADLAELCRDFSYAEMEELVRALFGKGDNDWDKAVTETTALSWLQQRRVLHSLGWPAGSGTTPVFDGAVLDQCGGAGVIGFDIKQAGASGHHRLLDLVEAAVSDWGQSRGFVDLEVALSYPQPFSQSQVGKELRPGGAFAQLREKLGQRNRFSWKPLRLRVADIPVEVWIRKRNSRAHDIATGGAATATAVEEHLLRHVPAKADKSPGDSFLILYIQPPARALSDVRPRGIEAAVPRVEAAISAAGGRADQLWLGVVHLDLTMGDPGTLRLWLRPNATWPAGSSPETLEASLQARHLEPNTNS